MFIKTRIAQKIRPSMHPVASRSVVAIVGGIILMLFLFWVEIQLGREQNCPTDISWLICQLEESVFMETAETFGFLVAIILFILDAPDRQKQANYESWQAIDGAAGVETSYARIAAMQDLNQRRISLRGVDAIKADLTGIRLENAILRGANFEGSTLKRADLRGAILEVSKLQDTDFQYAMLQGANLKRADLRGATFRNADLRNADFRGANINGADFTDANCYGALFEPGTRAPHERLKNIPTPLQSRPVRSA
ncbi:MAG: pentapeptide repeat-containing protein [Symploca sp. SIO2G7]|nr:pentapeptide repeat-containing protein [Symploca sp. SIO2G7]